MNTNRRTVKTLWSQREGKADGRSGCEDCGSRPLRSIRRASQGVLNRPETPRQQVRRCLVRGGSVGEPLWLTAEFTASAGAQFTTRPT